MELAEVRRVLVGRMLKYGKDGQWNKGYITDIRPRYASVRLAEYDIYLSPGDLIVLQEPYLTCLVRTGFTCDKAYQYKILNRTAEPINWEQRYYDMVVAKFANITKPLTDEGKLELLSECLKLVNLYKDNHDKVMFEGKEE